MTEVRLVGGPSAGATVDVGWLGREIIVLDPLPVNVMRSSVPSGDDPLTPLPWDVQVRSSVYELVSNGLAVYRGPRT